MASINEQLRSYSRSTGPRSKGFRLGATIDTSRLSALGCGAKCCKLSLTGLSVFLVVTGIAVLAGGGYAATNLSIISAIGTTFTNCIIAFGVILLVIGTIGLIGAIKENRPALMCFLAILGLMMLALLAFGAWALSMQGQEGVILGKAWTNFNENQKENAYTCCGAYYYGEACSIANCPCTAANCGGCFPPMITDFRTLYTSFGVIFILISGIMIVTIVTAVCLMTGISSAESAKLGAPKK